MRKEFSKMLIGCSLLTSLLFSCSKQSEILQEPATGSDTESIIPNGTVASKQKVYIQNGRYQSYGPKAYFCIGNRGTCCIVVVGKKDIIDGKIVITPAEGTDKVTYELYNDPTNEENYETLEANSITVTETTEGTLHTTN